VTKYLSSPVSIAEKQVQDKGQKTDVPLVPGPIPSSYDPLKRENMKYPALSKGVKATEQKASPVPGKSTTPNAMSARLIQ
jgi:hypothetical protein